MFCVDDGVVEPVVVAGVLPGVTTVPVVSYIAMLHLLWVIEKGTRVGTLRLNVY